MKLNAYSIFADDVRQEIGNKSSIMGIYTGELFVQSFPLDLPRIWACTFLTARYSEKFNSVSVTVKLDDETLLHHPIPQEFLKLFWDEQADLLTGKALPADHEVTLPMHILITELKADKSSKLEILVNVDDSTVTAGYLYVREQPAQPVH